MRQLHWSGCFFLRVDAAAGPGWQYAVGPNRQAAETKDLYELLINPRDPANGMESRTELIQVEGPKTRVYAALLCALAHATRVIFVHSNLKKDMMVF